jgi:hypothetical protein
VYKRFQEQNIEGRCKLIRDSKYVTRVDVMISPFQLMPLNCQVVVLDTVKLLRIEFLYFFQLEVRSYRPTVYRARKNDVLVMDR